MVSQAFDEMESSNLDMAAVAPAAAAAAAAVRPMVPQPVHMASGVSEEGNSKAGVSEEGNGKVLERNIDRFTSN
jgi:hypothetical protein